MPSSTRRVFHFGPFELLTAPTILSRQGALVAITPKALGILSELVLSHGHPKSKDELLAAVWPGTAVEEASLSQNIYLLRKLLAADFPGQTAIENLPRIGYRFNLPVEEIGTPSLAPTITHPANSAGKEIAVPETEPASQSQLLEVSEPHTAFRDAPLAARNKGAKAWLWSGTAALFVACAAAGVYSLRRPQSPNQPLFPHLTRWTTSTSDNPVNAAALSPDGQTLIYTDADGLHSQGRRELAPTRLQIPNLKEIEHLSWFPDGKHVAVSGIAAQNDSPQVWRVAVDGSSSPSLFREDAQDAAVSSKAGLIAFLNKDGTEVWESQLDGADAHVLRTSEAGTTFDQMLWIFGSSLLLVEQVKGPTQKELEINPNALPSPDASTLLALDSRNGSVTGSASGYRLEEGCSLPDRRVLLDGLDQERRLVQLAGLLDPGAPRLFRSPPMQFVLSDNGLLSDNSVLRGCSVAADTGDIAVLQQKGHPAVYVGDLADGDRTLLHPHPLTSSEFGSFSHAWSPDGMRVLFEQFHDT